MACEHKLTIVRWREWVAARGRNSLSTLAALVEGQLHNEVVRCRFILYAGMLFVWVTLVAILGVFLLFPRIHHSWVLTGTQVLLYFAMVLPILVWAPKTFRDFASPNWQRLAALLLAAGSLGAAAALQHQGIELFAAVIRVGVTAVGEEIIFRGFIWDQTRRAGWGMPLLIVANVIAFALWHIPSMLAGYSSLSVGAFAVLLLVGLILCVLRLVTRSLILPAAVHFAIDIF